MSSHEKMKRGQVDRSVNSIRFCLSFLMLLCISSTSSAEKLELAETYTNDLTFDCEATVTSKGDVFFTKSEDKKDREQLAASASFRFLERRLPPAGRDALAFRAVRQFQSTNLKTTVGAHLTDVTLPRDANLIVSEGFREGIRHYSPNLKLTRDSLDLLELPGDPLVLIGLLPLEPVEIEDEWEPSDWVMQMLTGIEAVESTELNCKLAAANAVSAKVSFTGKVKGQRFGANTEVDVRGTLIFDLRTSHIAKTQAIYNIKADVGTVDPGLDLTVSSNLVRTVSAAKSPFTNELIDAIPLDPAKNLLELEFSAPEWGVQLAHDRNWHLYQAVIDAKDAAINKIQPVAIFRLVEHGSLVCQANFSPKLNSAPGQIIPIEQFEADIEKSLGKNFKSIADKEELTTPDGRTIYRVVTDGEQEYKGVKGSVMISMNWIYYLVTNNAGQQISFVFAVEEPLAEQLNKRDLEFVQGQRFTQKTR
jgi:hypothetical protein